MLIIPYKKVYHWLKRPISIAPLAVLRMAFGAIMLISTLRFISAGWIADFYIKPKFHFTFYGFEWVKPLPGYGMYVLFGLMALATIMIMIGLIYRWAITFFFLAFTYVEFLDKTTYLNHYYFVSIIAFLLIFVPANRYFSIDVWFKPTIKSIKVPAWCINIFKVQLVMVYFFAGLSKLTYDWLILAIPLRIWLPANTYLPIIGGLMDKVWVAYLFSWAGAIFDLAAGFVLLNGKYRKYGYVAVVIFHLATGCFFKIGMFPYLMIFLTVVFFDSDTQLKIINFIKKVLALPNIKITTSKVYHYKPWAIKMISGLLCVYFTLQLFLPFRFLLYPGKLFWTEEGYRFSWRVMLMEKGGTAFFYVKNPANGKSVEIDNSKYLTSFQENMMSTQPDMILQYAHFLAKEFQKKGIKNPVVTAESFVTQNGSGSRSFINSQVDLAKQQETFFGHHNWVLPY